jgi:hypothetical protein
VNGDGYADVIVGGYNGNVVRVFQGGPSGISTTAASVFDQLAPGSYGTSVASAGDANGDGYADVVFAPSRCTESDVYVYPVYVYPGSSAGVTTLAPLRTWSAWSAPASACFNIIAR